MAGSNFRRGADSGWRRDRGGRDGYGDRYGHRRPYQSLWWPTSSYYAYPWIWPSYPTILDCDNPDDDLGCGYGYGGYADNGYGNDGYGSGAGNGAYDNGDYGYLGADPGYGDPSLGPWPSAPPQSQPMQPSAGPSPEASSEEPVTLIFKDGRPAEQIHNYVLTPTTIYVGDGRRREIPLDQVDIPATEKANREAGVDFHLPRLQVSSVPDPDFPDTHVLSNQ